MLRATLVILLAAFFPAVLYSQATAEDGGTRSQPHERCPSRTRHRPPSRNSPLDRFRDFEIT